MKAEYDVLELVNLQQEVLGLNEIAISAKFDTELTEWVVEYKSGKYDNYSTTDLETIEELLIK